MGVFISLTVYKLAFYYAFHATASHRLYF